MSHGHILPFFIFEYSHDLLCINQIHTQYIVLQLCGINMYLSTVCFVYSYMVLICICQQYVLSTLSLDFNEMPNILLTGTCNCFGLISYCC